MATARRIPSAGGWAQLLLDSVVAAFTDLEELRGNLTGEEQRLAVVEIDAFFPCIERVDRDHDVIAPSAAAAFLGVLGGQREMQEPAPAAAQSVARRAIRVAGRNADKEQLRRPRRLSRLDVDRMPVQRTHACAEDFIARAVAGANCVLKISERDWLAQTFVQGLDDAFGVAVSLGVEFEIELLRLVAQHVREGAGNTFDQSRVGHSPQVEGAVGVRAACLRDPDRVSASAPKGQGTSPNLRRVG